MNEFKKQKIMKLSRFDLIDKLNAWTWEHKTTHKDGHEISYQAIAMDDVNQALDEIMNEGDIIHIVSNTKGKLFCSMAGKGVCPYEKEGGECIMKDPCKNHTTK